MTIAEKMIVKLQSLANLNTPKEIFFLEKFQKIQSCKL
jgi:hypothetical protein